MAGILKPSALAGYRNHPVYLRGSWHVPPRLEAVPEGMDALFALLEKETEPAVRTVLGHWLVGYVHPYPDGNGRMARFLMNAMLALGGANRRWLAHDHRLGTSTSRPKQPPPSIRATCSATPSGATAWSSSGTASLCASRYRAQRHVSWRGGSKHAVYR
ncbi:Fic family protein [Paramesorhizobium deserti]|uniref:Fic family protein n=1 Tax=Paramesorhizobium deserti TaxID=1494590 RepID=UPI001FCD2B05|nr:Fic family protein [Paramesorhizobium deserti]